MEKKWSNDEVEILVSKYAETTNSELIKILNRSCSSISMKAGRIGLRKSKKFKSRMISKRNKMVGRDLTYNELKRIALLYKSRGQFQICDPSAYTTAMKMKVLDDICPHMINQSYSIPQLILKYILSRLIGYNFLYNTRKIISPYELDIYFPDFKLAFEYDGKGWHKNNRIDKRILCDEKNIKLITIVENNRKYEQDIKYQLSQNIDDINNILNKNISLDDINDIYIDYGVVYGDIIDTEYISNICNSYDNYHKFKTENVSLYNKLISMKIIDEFTSHMDRTNPNIIWNEETIKVEVIKYEYLKDFIKKSQGCYLHILKNNLKHLLNPLKRSTKLKWDMETIKTEILKYKKLSEFYKNSRSCYNFVMGRDLKYLLSELER